MRSLLLSLTVTLLTLAPLRAAQAQEGSAEQALSAIREQIFSAHFAQAISSAEQYLNRTDLTAAERNAGRPMETASPREDRSGPVQLTWDPPFTRLASPGALQSPVNGGSVPRDPMLPPPVGGSIPRKLNYDTVAPAEGL